LRQSAKFAGSDSDCTRAKICRVTRPRVPSPAFGAEVTAIGVPDPYGGQSAKALIALKPGHPAFGINELWALLTKKLCEIRNAD
jgi:hypothetical protein